MYNVLKSAISAGGFKLAEMQHKIKKLYVTGDLTEEQMDELLTLATLGVSVDAERPEVLRMLQGLADRVAALEEKLQDQEQPGEDLPEYEAWLPWDGVSNKYQPGAIVAHNGQVWESIHPVQNVWEPGAPGTENMWKIRTKAANA